MGHFAGGGGVSGRPVGEEIQIPLVRGKGSKRIFLQVLPPDLRGTRQSLPGGRTKSQILRWIEGRQCRRDGHPALRAMNVAAVDAVVLVVRLRALVPVPSGKEADQRRDGVRKAVLPCDPRLLLGRGGGLSSTSAGGTASGVRGTDVPIAPTGVSFGAGGRRREQFDGLIVVLGGDRAISGDGRHGGISNTRDNSGGCEICSFVDLRQFR
mmetsp:Transcript_3564/g.7436  ORF Transcript_3564/g.7436 Transcript_3564/m.7436 type:complete len:210 (+) Transcript_3564:103-732(+)